MENVAVAAVAGAPVENGLTEEQKAQAAAEAAAAKEAAKAAKQAEREAAKAAKAAEKEAARVAKQEAKKQAEIAKQAEKEAAKAAKEAARMPTQNGIRRPKPETLCGQAWTIFDNVSSKNNSPASIGESMEIARQQGLNESNVRAEYARWRKFHGIVGRIENPASAVQSEDVTGAVAPENAPAPVAE